MASLDSYIKERDEKIKSGKLIYNGTTTLNTTKREDFHKLNCNTFKHNNGMWSDKTKLYY